MITHYKARCSSIITLPLKSRKLVFGEDALTFTIHASKDGPSVVTVRIGPAVAVDKARVLEGLGW
jgi:hypothetical protein